MSTGTENKMYELSFLARGEEAAGSVVQHLNQLGAEITNERQIEKVNLAYPINKHTAAHFGCLYFSLKPELVKPLKDALRFEDGLLRYLIVTPPLTREEESISARPIRPGREAAARETEPRSEGTLSNEDLEAKLEEISGSLPTT